MTEFEIQVNETFVPVRGFEHYFISNQGRCWNSRTKRFVGANDGSGYRCVSFRKDGKIHRFKIHRLVILHFGSPQPEDKTDIDHIDRDKQNNRIENLRWVSKSENQKNKDKYKKQPNEYIDELPDTAVELEHYNGFDFDRYYFDYESKKLIMRTRSGKLKFVNVSRGIFHLYDIDEIEHTWRWGKFLEEMMNRIDDGVDDVDLEEDSNEFE